jgi:eukaryotic-like serine/threonine-protein kinase
MKGLANVGDILAGKYRVERILGIGGMGMVVLATHLELDQHVAIKFMLPAALENPEAAARFMREARAAGRLTSEHVCRVSDVGRFDSGVPYIVMEYLEGHDLGTMLKRKGPLPVADAVDFILQACEGMAEAHGHGIVHRDLKPDNLFLHSRSDGSQVIKVLDFGISKASVTGIATKTGDIMGSPAYMAPEQMQSTKDVDMRADVWSLGVILYQLISGRMPFISDTLPGLCLAVINDAPPSLESIRSNLPHGLAQVVMRCLAKNKNDRFPNVHELAQSLAPYGRPECMAAITRIRSMLQRKRQATTPPPLMMLPSEFSDVAPTLVGDEDSIDIPRQPTGSTPMPQLVKTTLGTSSGESMSMFAAAHGRVNKGVIGALVGAIALVGLIIVMVLIKRGNTGDDTAAAGQPSPPPPPPSAPAPEPTPTVEPIKEAAKPEPAVEAKSSLIVEESAPVVDDSSSKKRGTSKPKPKSSDKKDVKKETSDKKDVAKKDEPKKDEPKTDTPPPDEEEDKWGRMHHDGDREPPPPPKKPAPEKEESKETP